MTGAEYDREFAGLPAYEDGSDELADADVDEIADDRDDGPPEPFYPFDFDERDCSGVFDGIGGVVSDADPGL
jgi:hypothetical protein